MNFLFTGKKSKETEKISNDNDPHFPEQVIDTFLEFC